MFVGSSHARHFVEFLFVIEVAYHFPQCRMPQTSGAKERGQEGSATNPTEEKNGKKKGKKEEALTAAKIKNCKNRR